MSSPGAPRPAATGGKAKATGRTATALRSPAASSSSATTSGGVPSLSSLEWSAAVTAPLLACASPSLSGELLRLSLCEYLRTQVCTVHLVVVLYGFNSHEYEEDDDVPIRKGKLCYAAVTQSEIAFIDATQIGYVSDTHAST